MKSVRRDLGPVSLTLGRRYTVESQQTLAGDPAKSEVMLLSEDTLDRLPAVMEPWQADLLHTGQVFRVSMVEVL